MATKQDERIPELKMDPAALYREDIYTDNKAGTLRQMTPVKADGSPDPGRRTLYIGQAELLTAVGALPLSFAIDAQSLKEAAEKFAPAANQAVERALQEIQELRRQAASQIVVPKGGAGGFGGPGGAGGIPGGGIKLP